MDTYLVQLVGQPAQPIIEVDAQSALYAVAEAAECDIRLVCLPIWRAEPRSPTGGTVASARYLHQYDLECYMPLDESGRQWLVRRGAPH